MLQQSNALRRLEEILTEAVEKGDKNHQAGPLLLEFMNLGNQPQDIVDFYELLNKAEEEAKSIKNKSKLNRYLKTIEELHHFFVVNHLWTVKWNVFSDYINNKGILNTLDSLAEFFSSQNPTIRLEKNFLEKLCIEFEDLSHQILTSTLSKDFKNFLLERIEDILRAIREYHVNGAGELEKIVKSSLGELVIVEGQLDERDKSNSVYKRIVLSIVSLAIYIKPTLYDIIGAVPDIDSFWRPKIEELIVNRERAEQIVCEKSNIHDMVKQLLDTFDKQQNLLESKDFKALPPSKDELEVTTDNRNTAGPQIK